MFPVVVLALLSLLNDMARAGKRVGKSRHIIIHKKRNHRLLHVPICLMLMLSFAPSGYKETMWRRQQRLCLLRNGSMMLLDYGGLKLDDDAYNGVSNAVYQIHPNAKASCWPSLSRRVAKW